MRRAKSNGWASMESKIKMTFCTTLFLDEQGSVYLTGPANGHLLPTEPYDIATVKYDSEGQMQWEMSYESRMAAKMYPSRC